MKTDGKNLLFSSLFLSTKRMEKFLACFRSHKYEYKFDKRLVQFGIKNGEVFGMRVDRKIVFFSVSRLNIRGMFCKFKQTFEDEW